MKIRTIPILPRSGNYLEDMYDDYLEQQQKESTNEGGEDYESRED
jgi:hypothetical protein